MPPPPFKIWWYSELNFYFYRNPYFKKEDHSKINEDETNENTPLEQIKKQDENKEKSKIEDNKGEKSKIVNPNDKINVSETKDKPDLSKEPFPDAEKKELSDQKLSKALDKHKLADNTDSLSDISISDDNNEDESCKLTKEEKHQKYREERKFRYELFVKEVKDMNEALDKSKDDMTNKPTEHPDYAKEWAAFYKAKVAELRRKGKNIFTVGRQMDT